VGLSPVLMAHDVTTPNIQKSFAWLTAARVFNRAQSAVKVIIVGRLITPASYGEYAVVVLVLIAFETFTQLGFNDALIYDTEPSAKTLNTAWTAQILRCSVVALLLLLVAPFIGPVASNSTVQHMIRVTAIQAFLVGFENIGIVYFQKDLHFHKQFLYFVLSGGASLITAAGLGALLHSAWALVFSSLAAVLVRVISSYVLHSYRPRFEMARDSISSLLRFGKWITANSMTMFLAQRVDQIIIARFFSTSLLGVYQMANLMGMTLAVETTGIAVTIGFPLYMKYGARSEQSVSTFLATLRIVACSVLPGALFVAMMAQDIVPALLGQRWSGVIGPLRISAVAAAILCLDTPWTPRLYSLGLARMEVFRSISRTVVLAVVLYPLTSMFGAVGSALAMLISTVTVIPTWWIGMRSTSIRARDLLLAIAPGLLLSALVVSVVWLVRSILRNAMDSASHLTVVAGSALVTGLLMAVFLYLNRDRILAVPAASEKRLA